MFGTKWIIVWVVWPCLTYLLRTTIFSSEVERVEVQFEDFPSERKNLQISRPRGFPSHALLATVEFTPTATVHGKDLWHLPNCMRDCNQSTSKCLLSLVTLRSMNGLCSMETWDSYGGFHLYYFYGGSPKIHGLYGKSYGKSQSKMDDEQGHPMT